MQDKIIGYIGILAIFGNTIGGILTSMVVDRMKGKMKKILLVLMVLGTACWFWLGLICLGVIPFSLGTNTILLRWLPVYD